MSHDIYALTRCDAYGLSPEEVLRNQFAITETTQGPVPGLAAMAFERWTLHSGADVPVIPMEDTKGRL